MNSFKLNIFNIFYPSLFVAVFSFLITSCIQPECKWNLMRNVFLYSRLILLPVFVPHCIQNLYHCGRICTGSFILFSSSIWWAKLKNRVLLSAAANRQRWESLVDELGERPWDSFLFTSDIFYKLEKVARIGLHSNIWVEGGVVWIHSPALVCTEEFISTKLRPWSRKSIFLRQKSSGHG